MGLVDYSDSESETETIAAAPAPPSQAASAAATNGKKPFQKVVDRAKPGKILVNLPQSSTSRDETKPTDGSDEPPPKRARIGGGRGGAFSGFNSFLPPPKNAAKPSAASSSGRPAPRPGINLKTGAAPGFSRETTGVGETGMTTSSGDADPPAKQPSIPAEQKPAEEVKLVGKPLMFKPLSVSRKPGKKNVAKSATTGISKAAAQTGAGLQTKEGEKEATATTGPPPPKRQKISLFSIPDEPTDEPEDHAPNSTRTYEPMFSTTASAAANDDFTAYDTQYTSTSTPTPQIPTHPPSAPETLTTIAASLNLSRAARRELFGRTGAPPPDDSSTRLVSFDTSREYASNERARADGELARQAYNPVRALAGGGSGKTNLRQLIGQAQGQRDALEESFALGRSSRDAAGSRYGWR
ncbi:mitotic checkpoint regulator, MAD2B-interacting-domain-containing protein [Hypoxylon sp. NC1633]|nr:mitotic checkpoint regulator, MAD2B-interacting-domain-containing protein [Hypoxylon sp. NC1633]